MKALIVDDEKHVREGLLLLAEWEKYGIDTILEAEDGEEAIKLINEYHPEIIFTDMRMPKRDGINLLKWIHSSNLNSKTIVVSGYDDFEYLRNAIYYKSFDYLLKPIDPEILNETLERAVTEWQDQALFRKSQVEDNKVINEVKQLYWDRLFSSLLHKSQISQVDIEKIEKQFSVNIHQKPLIAAVIQVKTMIDNVFQGDSDLCFFSLNNICNEFLSRDHSGVCFRNLNKKSELVIVFWNHRNISILLNQIHSSIFQFTKVRCTIALGEPASHLKVAYESAHQVFKKHNLVEKKKIVTPKDIISRHSMYLLDYSQEFIWAIKSGSPEQMDSILHRIFSSLEATHCITPEQIHDWETQFEYLRQNVIKEYEMEIQLYRGLDYWETDGTFSFKKFKEEKRKEFQDLIKTLMSMKYQKEKSSIHLIEAYLRQNYQEDIHLQKIADRFFLSKEYISRKFKQEYNETITDYLTKIRMEKAKELLENPHLKIYEIAYNVGYQNEKYFSKVFKKIVGLTPNEYRNSVTTK
jgi:two-component system, response regulator YesN